MKDVSHFFMTMFVSTALLGGNKKAKLRSNTYTDRDIKEEKDADHHYRCGLMVLKLQGEVVHWGTTK